MLPVLVELGSLVGSLRGCMIVFLPSFVRLLLIVVMLVLLLGVVGFGKILWFILIGGFVLIDFLTAGGSGVLADPAGIDEEFRKAWASLLLPLWAKRRPALMNSMLNVMGGCRVWVSFHCRL